MTTESMKPYPAYKDSGIEWIGEIPEGWGVTQLKRLCDKVTDGSHLSPETQDTGYPYITVQDVKKTIIDFEKSKRISEKDYLALKKNGCQPKKDDVLLTKDGTIGRAVVIKENKDFVILSSLGLIRPSQSKIMSEYLRYYLISGINIDQMFSFIRGSALTRLTIKLIEHLLIAYPPISEQQSIATFLDNQTSKIDTLIENKQKQIELFKEERTAIINQAVTKGLNPDVPMRDSGIEWLGEIPEHWDAKKLKYLVKNINYKINSKSSDLKIALENIESFTGNLRNLNIEDVFESEGKEFINGDVLFNKLRPYLAKVYKAESRGICVSELLVLRPTENILSDFLYYRCLSTDFINEVNSSTYGSKMPRASWDFIENLLIPFTTKREQELIIKFIESETTKANNTISQIQQQIILLQEYRTALISEAVTGKIDLRNQHEFPTPQ